MLSSLKFILLINVKTPTIEDFVDQFIWVISKFMDNLNISVLAVLSMKKFFKTSGL